MWFLAAALAGVLMLGISGAIAALGDTLFPAGSLAEGLRQDFSAAAPAFVRLRVWHPIIAAVMALSCMVIAVASVEGSPRPRVKKAAVAVIGLFLVQLCIGMMNLVLHAPVPVQLVHLLTADGVWISMVLLAAAALESPAQAPLRSAHPASASA